MEDEKKEMTEEEKVRERLEKSPLKLFIPEKKTSSIHFEKNDENDSIRGLNFDHIDFDEENIFFRA